MYREESYGNQYIKRNIYLSIVTNGI